MVGDTAVGTATGMVARSTITAARTTGIARGMAATTAADTTTTTPITTTITTTTNTTITTTTNTTITTPEIALTLAATLSMSIAPVRVPTLLARGTNREAGTVPHPPTVGDRVVVPAEAQQHLVGRAAAAGNPGPPARVAGEAAAVVADGAVAAGEGSAAGGSAAAEAAVSEDEGRPGLAPLSNTSAQHP